jgi:DNA-binding protein H-NS
MAKSPVMKLKSELQGLSRKELEKHRTHVEQALEKLDSRKIDDARAALEKHAKELGVTLSEVVEGASGKPRRKKAATTKTKAKAKAKFRNPDDASQTWTGRGRQPAWYKSRVEAGEDPASMAI